MRAIHSSLACCPSVRLSGFFHRAQRLWARRRALSEAGRVGASAGGLPGALRGSVARARRRASFHASRRTSPGPWWPTKTRVEGVGDPHRVRAARGDHRVDEVGPVGAVVGDVRAAPGAQQVEELLQGLALASGAGPHQGAGIVVDDHHQVLVALAVSRSSSIPMRRRPAKRSVARSASAHTRSTTAPTVRQATRISRVTVDFEVRVASQAGWSSNALV